MQKHDLCSICGERPVVCDPEQPGVAFDWCEICEADFNAWPTCAHCGRVIVPGVDTDAFELAGYEYHFGCPASPQAYILTEVNDDEERK